MSLQQNEEYLVTQFHQYEQNNMVLLYTYKLECEISRRENIFSALLSIQT